MIKIWFDYRLAWNLSTFNGIRYFHMPITELWTPEIVC